MIKTKNIKWPQPRDTWAYGIFVSTLYLWTCGVPMHTHMRKQPQRPQEGIRNAWTGVAGLWAVGARNFTLLYNSYNSSYLLSHLSSPSIFLFTVQFLRTTKQIWVYLLLCPQTVAKNSWEKLSNITKGPLSKENQSTESSDLHILM